MTEPNLSLCAICGQPALFTDASPGANPVSYCSAHLPAHMQTAAAAGQMPLQSGASKTELAEQARELDIDGRSSMTKTELETAVAGAVASEAVQPELNAAAEVLAHDENAPDEAKLLVVDDSLGQSTDEVTPAPAPKKAARKK